MSGVERLGVFLRGCGGLAHPFLTLFVIRDGIELFAQAQPNGALQPHWPEVGAWPRHGERGLVQAAAEHRLGTRPITSTQHRAPRRGNVFGDNTCRDGELADRTTGGRTR